MDAQQGFSVELDESTHIVQISGASDDADVYRLLSESNGDLRSKLVARALKIGAVALRTADAEAHSNFIEQEFRRLQADFGKSMEAYFGPSGLVVRTIEGAFGDDGKLATKLESFFGPHGRFETMVNSFVGDEGKLQKSLADAIGENGAFTRTLNDFFGERGRLRQALDQEFGPEGGRVYALLNPDDKSKPLGRFRDALEQRLDPGREGSAFWQMKEDLRNQFAAMKESLGIQEQVERERQRGTRKGLDFETVVFEAIDDICAPTGDLVEHVGMEAGPLGDVGDVVIHLNPETSGVAGASIVVEAKNRRLTFQGKGSIYRELEQAIQNRGANFAIGAVESSHAERFGVFRYAAPNHILVAVDETADDHLALQLAIQMARIIMASRAKPADVDLDLSEVWGHVSAIETHLDLIRAMKVNLTAAEQNMGAVRQGLDQLRNAVRDSLEDLKDILQKSGPSQE